MQWSASYVGNLTLPFSVYPGYVTRNSDYFVILNLYKDFSSSTMSLTPLTGHTSIFMHQKKRLIRNIRVEFP